MNASTFLARTGIDGLVSDARRALQFGVLWGIAATVMETMAAPFSAIVGYLPWFLADLVPYWCSKCVFIAYVALRLERRHRGAMLVGLLLVAAIASSSAYTVWLVVLFPESGVYRFSPGVQPSAIFWYDFWAMLFYGSLLATGCIVASRASRMRRLLNQAEIDRGMTEALVAEIRLKELQASVNPEVLYGALAEVMRRYVAGLSSADRLLDGLVGFLRAAMPSLRAASSTLEAELELTRAYVRLRMELDPERGTWRIEAADDLGALQVPPLQLVDLIDRWTGADTHRAGGVMAISRCAGGARVELRANVGPHHGAPSSSVDSPPVMTFDFLNPAHLPSTG